MITPKMTHKLPNLSIPIDIENKLRILRK